MVGSFDNETTHQEREILMKKWYSGLNFIQVGTLLDLQDYLAERHNYSVEDGIIYESEENENE